MTSGEKNSSVDNPSVAVNSDDDTVQETDALTKNRRVRVEWQAIVVLCAICVFSFCIRMIDIQRGLWLDELHTSWVVNEGLGSVWSRAELGNQAPVYFWLVWGLVNLFGHTEWAIRLVSVLAGTGLSVLGFRFVTIYTRSSFAGLLAAGLVAIDPMMIEYSQEARPYALLQLVSWIQVLFFVSRFQQVAESENANWQINYTQVGFVLSAVLCFYVHFTSVLLTGACLFVILTWKMFATQPWRRADLVLLCDFIWISILCLPLVGSVMQISQRKSNWELFVNDLSYAPSLWFQLVCYGIPILVMVLFGLKSLWQNENRRQTRMIFALAVLYFFPVLGSWIAFKTGVAALYHPRYFMIGLMGIILMACSVFANVIRDTNRWVQYSAIASIVLMAFLCVHQNDLLWRFRSKLEMPYESSWEVAATRLGEQVQKEDAVYLFPGLIEDQFLSTSKARFSNFEADELEAYCAFPLQGIYSIDKGKLYAKSTFASPRFNESDTEEMLASQTVFLVIRGDRHLISDVLAEFAEFGPRNKLFIRNVGSRMFEYRGEPNYFIALFKFDVTEESSK